MDSYIRNLHCHHTTVMCRYQLCTKDGATLWHADQADNIDKKQLRQLAHEWLESRAEKLENIVWPKAAHMVDWLDNTGI